MNIYVYAKSTENIQDFSAVLDFIRRDGDEIYLSVESVRSFRKLEEIKSSCGGNDTVIISALSSLGTNEADICSQLQWFIDKPGLLIIKSVASTYEYGVSQPMNKAVLSTLLQSFLKNNKDIVKLTGHNNAGRNKIEFPEEWDILYEKWMNKEITSKEFLSETGLKKATFYNMLTEYKSLRNMNTQYAKTYKCI